MLIFYDFMSWPGCVYIYIHIYTRIRIYIYILKIVVIIIKHARMQKPPQTGELLPFDLHDILFFFFGSRFDLQNNLNPASTNFLKMETAETCRGFCYRPGVVEPTKRGRAVCQILASSSLSSMFLYVFIGGHLHCFRFQT